MLNADICKRCFIEQLNLMFDEADSIAHRVKTFDDVLKEKKIIWSCPLLPLTTNDKGEYIHRHFSIYSNPPQRCKYVLEHIVSM